MLENGQIHRARGDGKIKWRENVCLPLSSLLVNLECIIENASYVLCPSYQGNKDSLNKH